MSLGLTRRQQEGRSGDPHVFMVPAERCRTSDHRVHAFVKMAGCIPWLDSVEGQNIDASIPRQEVILQSLHHHCEAEHPHGSSPRLRRYSPAIVSIVRGEYQYWLRSSFCQRWRSGTFGKGFSAWPFRGEERDIDQRGLTSIVMARSSISMSLCDP